jgi:hypothetical protein
MMATTRSHHSFNRIFCSQCSTVLKNALHITCITCAPQISNGLLTTKDVALLCKRYEVPASPDLVDWGKFVDQIDKAFAVKGLETDPIKDVQLSVTEPHTAYGLQCAELSAVETAQVQALLALLQQRVTSSGLMVNRMFRDFDSANCGHVTPAQFLRQVDSMGAGSISAAAARTLAKAYMNTARGAVNYRALHADVTPAEEPFDDGNLYSSSCHDASDAGSSVSSVEDFNYDDSASCASSSYTAATAANGYYDSLDELTGAWGDAVQGDAPAAPRQQQPLELRLSPLEAKLAAKVRNEFIEVRADMY